MSRRHQACQSSVGGLEVIEGRPDIEIMLVPIGGGAPTPALARKRERGPAPSDASEEYRRECCLDPIV
jgi:hypothetical protein